jgi:hypothetical protein
MKDLRPQASEGCSRLDHLCYAAQRAEIDANQFLCEVALVSSDIEREGVGSMKSLLLDRIVAHDDAFRCSRCKTAYSEELPNCPHCGEPNPRYIPVLLQGAGGLGELGSDKSVNPMLVYITTPKLIAFVALWVAFALAIALAVIQVSRTVQIEGYNSTISAWSIYVIILILIALLWKFNFIGQINSYMGRHRRAAISWRQALILLGIIAGAFAATIVFMHAYGNLIGVW